MLAKFFFLKLVVNIIFTGFTCLENAVNNDLTKIFYCVKSVRIQSFPGPYFATFRVNTEKYRVSLCIQSEGRKIGTRKTPNTDTSRTILCTEH